MFLSPENMEDKNTRCLYCDALFATSDLLSRHMDKFHNVIPAEQMEFVPEVLYDENNKVKPRPYKQAKYVPMTDYEGT